MLTVNFRKIQACFDFKLVVYVTPTERILQLSLTICNRCSTACFFLRARNDRDLVTRHPGEISSFAVDIQRRIYKSKRGFTRARSRISLADAYFGFINIV